MKKILSDLHTFATRLPLVVFSGEKSAHVNGMIQGAGAVVALVLLGVIVI